MPPLLGHYRKTHNYLVSTHEMSSPRHEDVLKILHRIKIWPNYSILVDVNLTLQTNFVRLS